MHLAKTRAGSQENQQSRGEGLTTGSLIKEQRGTVKLQICLDLVFVLHLVLTFSFQERLEKSRAEYTHVLLQGTSHSCQVLIGELCSDTLSAAIVIRGSLPSQWKDKPREALIH